MEIFVQAMIVAFREGLEAFLIIAILLQFLNKSKEKQYKRDVWHGVSAGIVGSIILGVILTLISSSLGGTDNLAKLWESGASFVAVLLIATFIVWMIKHGSRIKAHVERNASLDMSRWGIFLISMVVVLREGAEIAIFSFAGKYEALPIFAGLIISIGVVFLIFYSIVNIKLSTIFNITLVYLILQAGFLIGYSVHEGLSASKGLGMIDSSNPVYTKAFDVSDTILNHKAGLIGIVLYVSVGWYSKPEWIQFAVQYAFTILLFSYWYIDRKRAKTS